MTKRLIISLTLLAGMILPAAADVNRGDVRIAWDNTTLQVMDSVAVSNAEYKMEPNLCYPRAKHLADGSLLLDAGGPTTRAQLAAMVERFCKKVAE